MLGCHKASEFTFLLEGHLLVLLLFVMNEKVEIFSIRFLILLRRLFLFVPHPH